METYHLTAASQIPQDCLRRQSYGICNLRQWGCSHVMIDYSEKGRYYAELIRKLRTAVKEKRWGKLSQGVCCITITHQPTLLPSIFETAASNCWITCHILQTCCHLTFMCSDLWRIRYVIRYFRAMKLSFRP